MTHTSRRLFLTTATANLAIACTPSPQPAADAPTEPSIDERQARTLAVKQYSQLSRGMYYRHPRTNELVPFPPMNEEHFQYVDAKGDAWLVRAQPPAGWTVIVRVDKGGDWVEVVSWGLAPA